MGAANPLGPFLAGTKQIQASDEIDGRPTGSSVPATPLSLSQSAHGSDPIPGPSSYACEFPGCSRFFPTARGRGLHHRKAHPDWYDSRTNTTARKPRWNDEEDAILARKEAELTRVGARFMNQALHQAFPERSLDSIKSHRRNPAYKERVANLLRASSPRPSREPRAVHPPINDTARQVIVEYLRQLPPSTSANFQQQRLDGIISRIHLASDEEIHEGLTLYIRSIFPPTARNNNKVRMQRVPPTLSKRKQRRVEYAKVQDLWSKNRSRCVSEILNNTGAVTYPPMDQMTNYWTAIMCSETGTSPGTEPCDTIHEDLWKPITPDEIARCYLRNGSAPGPDGVSPRLFRSIPVEIILKIFNLFLFLGKTPAILLQARTTFIAKKTGAQEPGDFRPITVTSVVIRCFHKILASRLSKCLHLDDRQRAFRSSDGCSENIYLLDLALRYHHRKFKSLFLASIDVSKAFDSLSHKAILDTLQSAGVPSTFVRYVRYIYETGTTRLSCPNWTSEAIRPLRGVKQGDPLSPILFNLVLDRLFKRLPADIGADIDGVKINAAAFADDIFLMSSTARGLQILLDNCASFLAEAGLQINAGKSFSLAIKSVPHVKKSVIDASVTFHVGEQGLPALKRTDQWTYLGVPFTPEGRLSVNPATKLMKDIETLSKAPFKPQQRLFILRVYIIPALYHLLALGSVKLGVLTKIDRTIRAAARKWLFLPHDTPNGYFHATSNDGGLGLPSLRWGAPLHRLNRLKQLPLSSQAATSVSGQFLQEEMQRAAKRLEDHGISYDTKYKINNRWAQLLYRSVDGAALKQSRAVKGQHDWVGDGTRFLTGKDFINSCRARINALPTRSRTSRGRYADRKCRAGCLAIETLNHVVQNCHRSHVARIKRHDALVHYLARNLRSSGHIVDIEPHFPTSEGLRKPDIVASLGSSAFIVDAQVVSEQTCLKRAHEQKVAYYSGNNDLIRSIKQRYNANEVTTHSCTLTWRGLWSPEALRSLNQAGLLRKKDVKVLSSRTLIGTLACYNIFCRSTRVLHGISRTGVG